MAIEFRCTHCNKLLRTGDDTAGKQAKCPECGTILTIPEAGTPTGGVAAGLPPLRPPSGAGTSPFAPGGPPAARPGEPVNPYQSPAAFGPAPAAPPGAFAPTRLDVGDIFGRTWTIFQEQWGMCLGTLAIVIVISLVVNVVVGFGFAFVGAMSRDEAISFVFLLLSNVITTLFGVWLGIGQAMIFLKIARGQPVSLGELFNGGPWFLNILLASILVGLIVLVGYVLCIVPGVILALMFSQYYYLILDRNVGVMDSLSISKDLTTGNKLTLFLIGLLAFLLVIAGCIPCLLGLIVVIPYLTLMAPVVYLAITGQPTADQLRAGPPMG